MKRVLVLVAALLLAAACTPATNQGTGNAPNANAVATAQPSPAAVSEADIINREKQQWDLIKNKNFDGFASMLADDQLYVTADGVHDKAASVEGVRRLSLTDITLSDFKVLKLGANAAVVTYSSAAKGTFDGTPVPDRPMRESSAWVNRGGKWLAVYHQDTLSEEPPPTPTPGASPAPPASPASSPAASPAATAATDAVSLEKQIWDALARRDWNAFAAYLAEDQLEVLPFGVMSKAQSVEGAAQWDFSKAVLSDFREVKLNADATLVTYVVKSPGPGWHPKGERHSTIWANRGGKWLAVFHQFTKIEK
jgi:hypothetical protein